MEMRPWFFLLLVSSVFQETLSQTASYLVTAPRILRLDATETVLVQLFGYTQRTEVEVSLKSHMGRGQVVYHRERVVLDEGNNYMAAARVRVFPSQVAKEATHVILHVQSQDFQQNQRIDLSRSNGFLVIQTDKPIYTPLQSVKVRVFSLNQELRPANRKVFLTFRDPDKETVDKVEITDPNSGIPSMVNPFKIPLNPKVGVWRIEATYTKDFTTTASADFEVKEYVLPSIFIIVKPKLNFISYGNFEEFSFKISARYVHGAPVSDGEVFIRYGYIWGNHKPVIIPNSFTRERLSSSGDLDVTVNVKTQLAASDHPTLDSLVEKYFYIAVLVQEYTGGIAEETEFASVKFVKSPYKMQLIGTPRFIKPSLPYNIQVLVRDQMGQPVEGVPIRLVEQQSLNKQLESSLLTCTGRLESRSDGFIVLICNARSDTVEAVFKFETTDPALPVERQASLTLRAKMYHSPNQRYLYIDPPQAGSSLRPGQWTDIRVYSYVPSHVTVKTVSYMVLSKGKVVDSRKGVYVNNNEQIVRFKVTSEMVPSIRLLVYYVLDGEGVSELVADSVWIDVKDQCVNGLKTELTYRGQDHRPKSNLELDVKTNNEGLVAFSAVDTAVFSLRRRQKDPVSMIMRHIELSDQGCGGGGGEDAQDVFRMAGLAILTNANAQTSQSDWACSDVVRSKRSLTDKQRRDKVHSFGPVGPCCEKGFEYIPVSVTCEQFAMQKFPRHERCRNAFADCCIYALENRSLGSAIVNNRRLVNAQPDWAYSDVVRSKRALTDKQKKDKVRSYGPVGPCCEKGFEYLPRSVTCEQFAMQKFPKHERCRNAFADCCIYALAAISPSSGLVNNRREMGSDFGKAPSLVRSVFPESWLWDSQPTHQGQVSIARPLPDSLTTWEITAVGMFPDGVCVADRLQVSVTLPLSINIPLPYQLVRGEQLEMSGSVYNQLTKAIKYCVTLTVGPGLCLLHSEYSGDSGLRSSHCQLSPLSALGVKKVTFTVTAMQPGEHTLNFTLRTPEGIADILVKKLRVVPEGLRREEVSGGRLDPQGLYGLEKTRVELKNTLPANVVPDSTLERVITINGDIIGEVLSVLNDADGIQKLANIPMGSAEAVLESLVPLIHIYRYLETTQRWNLLGRNIQENAAKLRQKIQEGVVSLSSFRGKSGDQDQVSPYSMWRNQQASTWLTAQVVKTFVLMKDVVDVDLKSLVQSVNWLIYNAQNQDGSFKELSSYKPKQLQAAGANTEEQSVYMTSFVLIGLQRASEINDPIFQLKFQEDSMARAASYLTQHAMRVKSVYVRAVATYAMTLYRPNSFTAIELFTSLENLAWQKGHPAEQIYWKESNVTSGWMKPDQLSGLTVETTAYVLLTAVHKGLVQYCKPILNWLTQDQHYGDGFDSTQDTVLTLEAITAYSDMVVRAVLDMDIDVHYTNKGSLGRVELRENKPVVTPIEVSRNDDITVSTGFGTGVSHVKLKTVYYQTMATSENCNFDMTIEIFSESTLFRVPRLMACIKYKPGPNDVLTESGLTVMEIDLPTTMKANLEDLEPFMEDSDPVISHYELNGAKLTIQTETVPSDHFRCVGFRVYPEFKVATPAKSFFKVYEHNVRGSICTKEFSFTPQRLQRLCVGNECLCMTAACATYRGSMDPTLTTAERLKETCQPHIKYAVKVKIRSSEAEGDFVTYKATIVEVMKNTDRDLEGISAGEEVDFIKKVTCSSVQVQNNAHYLVLGSRGQEVTLNNQNRYRLPLDSDAILEPWPCTEPNCSPPDCSSQECIDISAQLAKYALMRQLTRCPKPT